jgi:chromosome segregation ATPase
VKEEYPDLSKAPLRIQNAVAKAEKTTPKQLTSGLHKTSHAVGTATKELKNLRDAKVKHRERWIRHLQDSVKSWEQQLKLYNEQQTNYNNLIKKAKQDLDSARQTLEVLNKKAAGPEDQDSEVNQEEQSRLDSEATIMVQQVQEVLQACAKAATKVETMEISDGEEVPNVPAPKRQRSLEPFAGGPTAPAS